MMTFRSGLLVASVSALCAAVTLAPADAAQRMGLVRGAYDIAANGAVTVPAYCYDFFREAPRHGDGYVRVLASDSAGRVTVGNQTMSLERALSDNVIRVTGAPIDVPSFGAF